MFKKNIKPILMAGALALATAVSPVIAAEYSNNPYENPDEVYTKVIEGDKVTANYINGNTFGIKKTLKVDDHIQTLDTVTFTYKVTEDIKTNQDTLGTYYKGAPTVTFSNTNQSITFTQATATVTDPDTEEETETTTVSANELYVIFSTTTASPGVYKYTLEEEGIDTNQIKYGKKTYDVYVRVVNGDTLGSTTVDQIAIKDSTGAKVTPEYTNIYNEYADLTVTKKVTGKGAQTADDFKFTVTLTLPQNYVDTGYTKDFSFTLKDIGNTATTTGITTVTDENQNKSQVVRFNENNTAEITVTMTNNDVFTISQLPVGTKYTVTEDANGYTPTIKLNSKDVQEVKDQFLLDDGTDTVEITNNKDSSPLTGVIVNNMPYIALLGASGAGLVVLAAGKKRSKK